MLRPEAPEAEVVDDEEVVPEVAPQALLPGSVGEEPVGLDVADPVALLASQVTQGLGDVACRRPPDRRE